MTHDSCGHSPGLFTRHCRVVRPEPRVEIVVPRELLGEQGALTQRGVARPQLIVIDTTQSDAKIAWCACMTSLLRCNHVHHTRPQELGTAARSARFVRERGF